MRILITGKGSYIGSKIGAYFRSLGHEADEVDTVGNAWRNVDYSRYDSVVHVAAIVHAQAKGAPEELFRQVNTQLPVQIARLAKENGVPQFIFLSTMGVYGREKSLSAPGCMIDRRTPEDAVEGYGGSKLEAERRLRELENESFRVAVIRPPNVYGPGCRGNYIPLFEKLALLLFVCPYAFTDVRQSMLYIDNLSELVRLIAENRTSGIYLPQDDVTPNAVEMIHLIRKAHGKKTRDSRILGRIVQAFRKSALIKKIYGGILYDSAASDSFGYQYRKKNFEAGMCETFLPKDGGLQK